MTSTSDTISNLIENNIEIQKLILFFNKSCFSILLDDVDDLKKFLLDKSTGLVTEYGVDHVLMAAENRAAYYNDNPYKTPNNPSACRTSLRNSCNKLYERNNGKVFQESVPVKLEMPQDDWTEERKQNRME